MATLDSLKRALRQPAEEATLTPPKQSLSDAQYSTGLAILIQGAGWLTYEDFIIPQTSQLLGPLFDSRTRGGRGVRQVAPASLRPRRSTRSGQHGGLTLCTSLLRTHFAGDWSKVDSVACCEAGGFIFASALAPQVHVPLLLIREAGKLPPPTVSVAKHRSFVSSVVSDDALEERIELELDKFPEGADGTVTVVVDDFLSTGETLCAMLLLLETAGARTENVSVMVVAEFPLHRGRELLRQRGFSRTSVQRLSVFDGA